MSDQTGAPPISAEQIQKIEGRDSFDTICRQRNAALDYACALERYIERLTAQLAALTEERERLRAALKAVEWAGADVMGYAVCPSCRARLSLADVAAKHAPNCRLKAALTTEEPHGK